MLLSVSALCVQVLLNTVNCSKLKFDYQKFLRNSYKRDDLPHDKNIRLYTPHPPSVLVGKNQARRGEENHMTFFYKFSCLSLSFMATPKVFEEQ